MANDALHQGRSSYAGEFDHVYAVAGGLLRFCGHNGCLETVCLQQSILASCCSGLRQGATCEIPEHGGRDTETGKKLSDVADLFNPEPIMLRGRCGRQ